VLDLREQQVTEWSRRAAANWGATGPVVHLMRAVTRPRQSWGYIFTNSARSCPSERVAKGPKTSLAHREAPEIGIRAPRSGTLSAGSERSG
jgi:hypothetical protein